MSADEAVEEERSNGVLLLGYCAEVQCAGAVLQSVWNQPVLIHFFYSEMCFKDFQSQSSLRGENRCSDKSNVDVKVLYYK